MLAALHLTNKETLTMCFISMTGAWISRHCNKECDLKEEVEKFIEEFREDGLFDLVPGRQHSAFPGFVSVRTIDNPGKLKQRLKKYARKLDAYRDILP